MKESRRTYYFTDIPQRFKIENLGPDEQYYFQEIYNEKIFFDVDEAYDLRRFSGYSIAFHEEMKYFPEILDNAHLKKFPELSENNDCLRLAMFKHLLFLQLRILKTRHLTNDEWYKSLCHNIEYVVDESGFKIHYELAKFILQRKDFCAFEDEVECLRIMAYESTFGRLEKYQGKILDLLKIYLKCHKRQTHNWSARTYIEKWLAEETRLSIYREHNSMNLIIYLLDESILTKDFIYYIHNRDRELFLDLALYAAFHKLHTCMNFLSQCLSLLQDDNSAEKLLYKTMYKSVDLRSYNQYSCRKKDFKFIIQFYENDFGALIENSDVGLFIMFLINCIFSFYSYKGFSICLKKCIDKLLRNGTEFRRHLKLFGLYNLVKYQSKILTSNLFNLDSDDEMYQEPRVRTHHYNLDGELFYDAEPGLDILRDCNNLFDKYYN